MKGKKFEIAKSVAKAVIDTLTAHDYVNVICGRNSHWDEIGKSQTFQTEVLSCQQNRIVQATLAGRPGPSRPAGRHTHPPSFPSVPFSYFPGPGWPHTKEPNNKVDLTVCESDLAASLGPSSRLEVSQLLEQAKEKLEVCEERFSLVQTAQVRTDQASPSRSGGMHGLG